MTADGTSETAIAERSARVPHSKRPKTPDNDIQQPPPRTERRPRTAEPSEHRTSAYEPESPRQRQSALSLVIPRRMRLPADTIHEYTTTDEYQHLRHNKNVSDRDLARAWDLSCRFDLFDAVRSYPRSDLLELLDILRTPEYLALFTKIHEEKEKQYRSGTFVSSLFETL
jgi:hypothetical protein